MSRRRMNMPRPEKPRRSVPPAMEWKGGTNPGAARVTAVGNRRLLVENHTGVVEFTEACIRLSSKNGPITVEGSGLTLADMRRRQLIVCGNISRVTLPGGGDPS
ncbi:MAG: YabP/YqfC family sporulation protein [Eubacteriales bacterium]|nr:YabP/YqfC family sporulation protein [Eubacteriales bacterium]